MAAHFRAWLPALWHSPCTARGFQTAPDARGQMEETVSNTFETAFRAGALALTLAACGNHQRAPETAAAQAEARASEGGSAVESISEARCARESRCENIGADKRYSSMEDCIARIRDDWKDDLDARSCPSGVRQTELNECLGAIRDEECSSPFDTLERVAACTAGQICAD